MKDLLTAIASAHYRIDEAQALLKKAISTLQEPASTVTGSEPKNKGNIYTFVFSDHVPLATVEPLLSLPEAATVIYTKHYKPGMSCIKARTTEQVSVKSHWSPVEGKELTFWLCRRGYITAHIFN